jgi:hypothetical protein
MTFDVSRFTFDAWQDYFGVVMEQGRVQTDADWNEWLAEFARRVEAGTLDLMGRAAVPATTPDAFRITIPSGGGSISIGCGRMYVDGLLVENHAPYTNGAYDMTNAAWDPALEEISGAPQPPPATGQSIDYTKQRYLPGASLAGQAAGQYLAYLDVWRRPIVYLQDDALVDKAIGVDTSGRVQTVWQVKLMPVPSGAAWSCSTPDSQIFPAPSAGRLTTGVVPNPTAGPCCLTTGSDYTGAENQLYRVEIHNPGSPGDPANPKGATFKWSRDNGSVATLVTNIAPATNSLGAAAFQLTVTSLGRDHVLGFTPGNWIELLDEALELGGGPGEMYQIDSVDFSAKTITLTTQLQSSSHFSYAPPATAARTRIRRWDQSGVIYQEDGKTVWYDLGQAGSAGTIPVPASDTTLILESGVVVTFSLASPSGQFDSGDFWTFAARTADGSVETYNNAPPRGVYHHYTKLSVVTWPTGPAPDCRVPWPPSGQGACGCCGVTVGTGAQYTTIQSAINALPASGGEVSILPGRYFEYVQLNGRRDVVIKGCGAQTRIASPTLQTGGAGAAKPAATQSGLMAVVAVLGSAHVVLRDFCVEAGVDECGVLLDYPPASPEEVDPSNLDVRLAELVMTASTRPAILVNKAELVEIASSRMAMESGFSQWPGVQLSGTEIRFRHNWVGLLTAANAPEWLPREMADDLGAATEASKKGRGAPGGVQIAGTSKDVFVVENEIEGGSGNGVTLGSVLLLDANGGNTGGPTGVVLTPRDDCAKTVSNQLPGSITAAGANLTVVAGGRLINITIARNRIRNMGLCGIGPIGFFDLNGVPEAISVENLAIIGNAIESTLLWPLAETAFGYGAICAPDVKGLRIFDNAITDFGVTPGAAHAWGIFVLLAELAEISRNRVLETRDWALAPSAGNGVTADGRGGIAIMGVAPPSFASTASFTSWANAAPAEGTAGDAALSAAAPAFEPGLPALRIENNVARVAVGLALEAAGLGPFSILGNHFSTGGPAPVTGVLPATTVALLNLGGAIEFDRSFATYAGLYAMKGVSSTNVGVEALAASTNGTVLFANNICQLETRASGQKGLSSVFVVSFDHVLFANNQCWLDGEPDLREHVTALDAILLAVTMQANGNRFQESVNAVIASAFTFGLLNVTSANISTYPLVATALNASKLANANNITWV